jgi:hypothetical protein
MESFQWRVVSVCKNKSSIYVFERRVLSAFSQAAGFVFFAASAWAWIVAPHFVIPIPDRFNGLLPSSTSINSLRLFL